MGFFFLLFSWELHCWTWRLDGFVAGICCYTNCLIPTLLKSPVFQMCCCKLLGKCCLLTPNWWNGRWIVAQSRSQTGSTVWKAGRVTEVASWYSQHHLPVTDGIRLNWVPQTGFGQGYTMNEYQVMNIKKYYISKNTLLLIKSMHSI